MEEGQILEAQDRSRAHYFQGASPMVGWLVSGLEEIDDSAMVVV
jgi:hypothetical protein